MPPKRRVAVQVFEPFRGRVSQAWLRRAALCALDAAHPDRPCRLSLTIADDETVRDLNARFRGMDEVTDVLSFSTQHPGHWEGDDEDAPATVAEDEGFVTGPGDLEELGEIIISLPQVVRQATPMDVEDPASIGAGSSTAAGTPVERELALMVVHGVLHLLGHDHVDPAEQSAMQALERAALSAFFAAPQTRVTRRTRVATRSFMRGSPDRGQPKLHEAPRTRSFMRGSPDRGQPKLHEAPGR